MHYAPVMSAYLVSGNVQERESARIRIRRVYVRRHKDWSNFWNMSVVSEKKKGSVGERGRLPGI